MFLFACGAMMQGDKHSSQSIACLSGCDSEMARLFGIDFFSVLSRGSQFRVEAVMLRVAKPLPHRYILVSPSRDQVRLSCLWDAHTAALTRHHHHVHCHRLHRKQRWSARHSSWSQCHGCTPRQWLCWTFSRFTHPWYVA